MKKVHLTFSAFAITVLGVLTFSSCSNHSSDKTATEADTTLSDSKRIDSLTTEKKNAIDFKFSTAEINLPSPFEIVNNLYDYKAPFKIELMNPVANNENYVKTFKKEINFGVYGIDLSYINFYGQNQATIEYYQAVQKLAGDLNIDQVFSVYAQRYNDNSSNHDSVVAIVDNMFYETDNYLKKNDRYLVASHVLAGALIEVNYLSLNLLKDLNKDQSNSALYERIYNENRGIYHVINLFEAFTDKDSRDLLTDLKSYKKSYDDLIKSPEDLTGAKLDKAIVLINSVRNKLIKP